MFIVFFILGCTIGSFLNVLILRTREERSLTYPPSQCPTCQHRLHPIDLIPLFSFFLRMGKCHYCKTAISKQYPLVELGTGLFFGLAYLRAIGFDAPIHEVPVTDWLILCRDLIVGSYLIALFVYDLRYKLVPDIFVFPAIIFAFGFNVLLGYTILHLVAASALFGGFFALQYLVSKGRWVGAGDIFLGILMGAYLGMIPGLFALWMSYVGGAVVIVFLLLTKKVRLGQQIPFGPFLIIGTLFALFYGKMLMQLVESVQ